MGSIKLVFNTIWLIKRTQSDKVLRDKTFKFASDPKYDSYQRGLASLVHKIFDKKSSGSGSGNLQMNFITQLLENLRE